MIVRYIFHISDLHIMERNYNNIKNSFKILVNKIKEQGIEHSLLVICGDIFEYKSYLEPLDIFHYKAICSLLNKEKIKTLVIPGNHDYNNNSEVMMDNVSLLTDYPNIICKNKTGVYNVFDCSAHFQDDSIPIEFHVFSPIDKKIPEYGNDDNIKIAILHEPINYATYDNGEAINDARFNAGDLKRYDYVLLGDIHLHQFLSPRIAYSGSFVQKTKGEGIYKGYILWDIEAGKGEFFPIPLKELYIRIDANNDETILPDIDPKQKVRHTSLFYKNCSEKFIEELKATMHTKYGYINRIVNSNKVKRSIDDEKASIREDISHEKIIHELLKDDPIIPKIIDHHNKILLSRSEVTCTTYRLNYLYWSNILCYGEDNYIDFTNFKHNLIMLNGKNKEGKSSIIDILIRVLFNECERGYKEDIVNKSKNKGFIKFSFNIGDDEFVIEQVYNKNAKKQYHRLFKNGVNITKDTIIQTYEFLTKTIGIGEYKNFVNLTTALQNRKFLVDMAPKDFIALITKITNVDVLKDVEDENRKEINAMKRMNKTYEEDLTNLQEIKESELRQLEIDILHLKVNQSDLQKNIAKLNDKLIEINKGYDNTPIPNDLDDKHAALLQKIADNTHIKELSDSYGFSVTKADYNKLNKDMWEITGRLKTLQPDELERIRLTNYDELEIQKSVIQEKLLLLQQEIDRMMETCYKPKTKNFQSREFLEMVLNSYVPQATFILDKCSIDKLIELEDDDKNDELLTKGLPDYVAIKQSISELERKITNFTANFGSLVFDNNCKSCSVNRSVVYGIFDIRQENVNLAAMKSILA
ncbi:MAG: metallophosphoesterase, partial [Cetobacterium sp.]